MDNKFRAHYSALKILRQRCEFLQKRLDSIEEENCQLKLQKAQVQEKAVNNPSYNNCLEEQIILLNKQNDRMSHQIQVISTENQNLWSQLSTLMTGNETLGNMLTVSTAPGYREDSNILEILPTYLDDCNKESLEEISLKLINGILIGKTELESQYSQMIDLQKENNSPKNNYTPKVPTQFDGRASVTAMKGLIQKMNEFKEVLYKQKIDLNNAIKSVKNYSQNNAFKCSNMEDIKIKGNNYNLQNSNLCVKDCGTSNEEEVSDSDKTCPMCGKNFIGNFTSFYEHVTSHFEGGGDEVLNIQFLN